MEHFRLVNDMSIPAIGCGTNTFGRTDGVFSAPLTDDFSPVSNALKAGFRMFDTAMAYGNESGIGTAIRESGTARSELFIIGKLRSVPEFTKSENAVRSAAERSLDALKTSYFDAFLIHRPWNDPEEMSAVWKTMAKMRDEGTIRLIGVSNFTSEQLRMLADSTGIVPVINQIAHNSKVWNLRLIEEMKQMSVSVMAYAPLTLSGGMRSLLAETGSKYGKSFAQVMLRHNYQRGIISIPKSHSFSHLAENIDIFDFCLDEKDMSIIDERIEEESWTQSTK